MRTIRPFLAAVLLAVGLAAPAGAAPTVFEDAGSVFLTEAAAYQGVIVARGETILYLDGFAHDGEVHVDGAELEVWGSSTVQTLRVTADGEVRAPSGRLEVVRLIARDDARVEGDALDLLLPPFPREFETPEEEQAWFDWRFSQPPYLVASGRARLTLRSAQDDGLGLQAALEEGAGVELTGTSGYLDLEMRGDASLVADVMEGGGHLWDRSRVEIVGGNRWGGFDLHDDSFAHVRHVGASTGAFSMRLYDRAEAVVEEMADGALVHRGTGLLTVRDTIAPDGLDYQRELRVFLENPGARLALERFGGPWSLNNPACGANCNPFYLVLGEGAYVRAVDSIFHMEKTQVRFLELRESQAVSLYPTSEEGREPIRGECVLAVRSSAAGFGHEDVCSRIGVTVLASDGSPLPDATVTLLDVLGEPVDVYDVSTGEESPSRSTDDGGRAVLDFAPRGRPLQVRVEGQGWEETVDVLALEAEHEATVVRPAS